MVDIDILNELKSKKDKDGLQKYAAEFGIKVKKQFSPERMVELILEQADAIANNDAKSIPTSDHPGFDDSLGVAIEVPQERTQEASGPSVDLISEFNQTFGEPVPIKDLPKVQEALTNEIVNGTLHIGDTAVQMGLTGELNAKVYVSPNMEVVMTGEYVIPEDFAPLALIGRNPGFINIPYWAFDHIQNNIKTWKLTSKFNEFEPKRDLVYLQSVLYYIKKNGSVCVRESRNSSYHHFY